MGTASTLKTISEDVTDQRVENGDSDEGSVSELEYDSEDEIEDEEDEGGESDESSEPEFGRSYSTEDLARHKRSNPGLFPELEEDSRPYRVLHRVICASSTNHIFKLFEDVPVRGSVGHLSGFEPLRHEEDYVSKCPDLGFLIIKEHYCKPDGHSVINRDTASAGFSNTSHHYSENGRIRIIDQRLRRSMNIVSKAYIYGNGEEDICPPYLWLYHHRSEMEGAAADSEDDSHAAHISSLLEYANDRYGALYARADRHQRRGYVDRDTLPFLFLPNSLLVSRMKSTRAHDDSPVLRAFVLQDWPTFFRDHIRLEGWYYKHNSTRSTRAFWNVDVDIPLSEGTIHGMSTFPFKNASDTVRTNLLTRGHEYWSYRVTRNVCYEGWDDQEKLMLNDARLMIDYRTYRQLHSNSTYWSEYVTVRDHDHWPRTLDHDRSPTDQEYAMFPEILHAFLLKEKKWITIRIEQVYPIDWNTKAFDRLVLPDNTKDLIKSLVLVRTTEIGKSKGLSLAGRRKDIIAGKGNGLIMLLHGAPGTGKTLTAGPWSTTLRNAHNHLLHALTMRSVAEVAKRPLYNVTCGDIGTNPEDVEKYLKEVLFLGKTWNCILLLDEADVFLEERSLQDLGRNSLVSVFLRTLEYYDGVLILTSNRVGTFDEAFSSRIQVSLHFPLLDRPSRRKIWKNFLDMLQDDKEEVDYLGLSSRLDELSDIEINGRQIRNILTTARQLAMYKLVTLEWDHVQRAIRSVADFTRYMRSVHGHTEEQNARDEKLR